MRAEPRMLVEAREAPEVVERQAADRAAVEEVARAVLAYGPAFVVTLARGSSDHAATTLRYGLETHLRLPVVSAAPSVAGVYGADVEYRGALLLAVSQSGGSPDLVESLRRARRGGALTVALVNVLDSPLAHAADLVLPLHAGEERAVAATKSYLAALTLGARLLCALRPDAALAGALARLPDALREVIHGEALTRNAAALLAASERPLVLGRGLHGGVAAETALKLQETAGVGALAFSTSEFAHGPARLAEPGTLALCFQARDATARLTAATYAELRGYGADVLSIGAPVDGADATVPTPATGHTLTDPATSAVAAQLLIAHAALRRGQDPDAPPRLSKVTRTR
ncbi:glucosamine--fructose-6-phosphate aminotransferase (isomerizing) [Deinococcus metalli]|uniref:Glucosamine--fructose-6-phosphate aminotransferase n=1 Tax=Deinococcus metalli TaxID=1141878 RepID=A0A7W8KFZ8_9DEIO|nr:SIS domain-containing protein [Deinococcus metalli]MBB5376306.1 glucosamine--fructose-6-phosphate aminotransferase (isomerizing) [Deinococcus metalli]GHF39295.1 glucosamine--fructose-6-phosphate aminotransferase [Deinococcus metalli]